MRMGLSAALCLALCSFPACSDDSEDVAGNGADGGTKEQATTLFFTGGETLYMINADLIPSGGSYADGLLWTLDVAEINAAMDSTKASTINDCKFVDGDKVLLSGQTGCCTLVDIKTKEVLFFSTVSNSIHSAELLPDNRIVTANSTGSASSNNSIQLFDISRPNEVLDQHELYSAHGVAWNDANQRLYALGLDRMLVFELENWDTSSPSLSLEKTIMLPEGETTNGHDLRCVDSNTLTVSGKSAYLYYIDKDMWKEMKHFSDMTRVKSLNYNPETEEVWYTDSTVPEGEHSWETQTLCYVSNYADTKVTKTIRTSPVSTYKVRVVHF